jgi:DNA-binding protein HU-beta
MKKTELIATLAENNGVSQVTARSIINDLRDIMLSTLKHEKRFALSGFGVFRIMRRSKRICRNPQTGEQIKVRAHNVLTFKASKAVKDDIF